jgi:hypothetical protein
MGLWLTLGDENADNLRLFPSPITACCGERYPPLCHPEEPTRVASWESNDPASCTGNERGVPHSSPVFGLEWDTQHSTAPSLPVVIRSKAEGSAVQRTSHGNVFRHTVA